MYNEQRIFWPRSDRTRLLLEHKVNRIVVQISRLLFVLDLLRNLSFHVQPSATNLTQCEVLVPQQRAAPSSKCCRCRSTATTTTKAASLRKLPMLTTILDHVMGPVISWTAKHISPFQSIRQQVKWLRKVPLRLPPISEAKHRLHGKARLLKDFSLFAHIQPHSWLQKVDDTGNEVRAQIKRRKAFVS